MKFRFRYRTILKICPSGEDFGVGTVSADLDMTGWEADAFPYFVPVVAVSFRSNVAVTSVLLEQYDPDGRGADVGSPTTVRKVLLRDTTGTLTDFVEDNLGQGHPMPNRVNSDIPMLLRLTTSGAVLSPKAWITELWWEARWPSLDVARFFACMPSHVRDWATSPVRDPREA